jgi:hypothetical protein
MDVATIQMDPTLAREKLRQYRAGVHRKADAEWERAAVAYEALGNGTPLVVLSDAISQAPRDAKGRPRMAIARADRKQVRISFYNSRNFARYVTSAGLSIYNNRDRFPELDLSVAFNPGLDERAAPNSYNADGYALVPMVPPMVLGRRALKDHFILWEVEAWADSRIGARPDIDPYLLKRVADDLYAVVGEWDLTDVERAIMRDRRL